MSPGQPPKNTVRTALFPLLSALLYGYSHLVSGGYVMLGAISIFWLSSSAYTLFSVFKKLPPFKRRRFALAAFVGFQLICGIIFGTFAPDTAIKDQAELGEKPVAKPINVPTPLPAHAQISKAVVTMSGADVLKRIDPSISDVSFSDFYRGSPNQRLIQFTLTTDDVFGGGAYLTEAAGKMSNISQTMLLKHGNEFTSLRFFLKETGTDQYGAKANEPTFIVEIAKTELQKINWDNFTSWNFLNIAYIEKKVAGYSVVEAYCQNKDNVKYAERFCDDLSHSDIQK